MHWDKKKSLISLYTYFSITKSNIGINAHTLTLYTLKIMY